MIDFTRAADRFADELRDVALPRVALVEHTIATPPAIGDVEEAVQEAVRAVDLPRGSVAIGVGSRGIARIDEIVVTLVRELRANGAQPFIVPAMGSHGASTAEGQVEVLAHLGITEASMGVPIRATMETVVVGTTDDGLPVYVDALAYAADAIVVVNRVKPHTSFRGPIESGPSKMLAIGLGKLDGARSIHSLGWAGMRTNVVSAARAVLATGKIAFALAIVENAHDEPCRLEAISAAELPSREPVLLEEAKANLARLPFDRIDVLVVDHVGKNISGGGADPNVTGRFPSDQISGGPSVQRLVYLAMTDVSDGNGNGIGLADVVSAELAARWDPLPTYLNALTTTAAGNSRLPMVMPTKPLAVAAALRMCAGVEPERAIVVRIASTLQLDRMWLSEAALAAAGDRVRALTPFTELSLDDGYASRE
ncbi:MAG TPA: lactate racemase domain-containing protein [Candidatus Acidoferrum sp.]|jgi:hypothetical protein|nr:lactate racemase domain-containing protein [Candidatus Acidoferrum sp.]